MSELVDTLEFLEIQSRNDFRREALINILIPLVKGQMVLDVGCGKGFMTENLVGMKKVTISLDTEFSFVKYTVLRTNKFPRPASGVYYAGEILPFASGTFDSILAIDVIEHVENDDYFVSELVRVLANTGTLIIVIPAIQHLYGKRDKALGHYRRYNKMKLRKILHKSNCRINYLKYWNLLGTFPYAFSELILHREISDKIRQGNSSPFHTIIAKVLSKWLLLESKLYIPIGLSLIAEIQKLDMSSPFSRSRFIK